MRVDAFITTNDENKMFDINYFHNPNRWNEIDISNLNIIEENWSNEIKFLDDNETGLNEEISRIPQNMGGVYVFFIKGKFLPYFENYISYIGRAQFTNNQNLGKRCRTYYYEFFKEDRRPKIRRLIEKWGKFLYIRYYPSTDNNFITEFENKLVNGILPPFNDEIPEIIYHQPTSAF